MGSQVISLQVSSDGSINKLLVLHMMTWVVIATFFFECLVTIIDLNIYVPINVNLEGLVGWGGGGRRGKGRGFELEANFWVKCPTAGPS